MAVYAAVRAVATARSIAHGSASGHDIAMQPVLQSAPQTKREAHGIRLYLYRIPLLQPRSINHYNDDDSHQGSGAKYCSSGDEDLRSSSVPHQAVFTVRVSASTRPQGLAGSLATVLEGPKGRMGCIVQSAGAFAVYRWDYQMGYVSAFILSQQNDDNLVKEWRIEYCILIRYTNFKLIQTDFLISQFTLDP